MNLDVLQAIAAARDLGAYGALALAIVGGWKGWYVWRWQYDEQVQRAAEWKQMAMGSLGVAEKATERRGASRSPLPPA